ncbi:DUF2844 domain-containing protein [Burkholderia pseudomallei]|uniref:DUF2844 domain-containing protein n=1 Tax=Burkholderia pseudomallei TaxID=28450 RepID=UPI000F051846|nr:DUF2844 domain-containing protein [Burkholderia pseudomallei]VBF10160.1 Protein of uncharacterised function (DUF2844) [Burkholderia pseudomallei]
MSTKVLTIIVSTLATVAAVYPDLAGAALGGEPVNYEAGGQVPPHIYDVRPESASQQPYTVQRDLIQNRTEVHQYIDGNGKVFAVTWSGSAKPDIQALLGSKLFSTMIRRQSASQRGSHHSLSQQNDDLVVQSQSHGRLFRGRAWIPSMLPQGTSPEVIQ